ncbi:Pkinase-domain-containing protein [Schizophyllum commune Loenen D]|nr:Pkinase-domain-containing protein [Schizophyllum commune Loenen D]
MAAVQPPQPTRKAPISHYYRVRQGVYATVYKGRSRITNELVALKETTLDEEHGIPYTAMREVTLLRDLKHPNVIRLREAIITESLLTLVFDFCNCDLKQYMQKHGNCGALPPDVARSFMKQLLEGTAYCHESNVIHRDLKPENVFVNSKGELKLGDFGLSRPIGLPDKRYGNEVVTLWYRAPELLLGSTSYGPAIDIWSCGCILAEMNQGTPLFRGADLRVQTQLNVILRIMGVPPKQQLKKMKEDAPELDIDDSRFPTAYKLPLTIDLLQRLLNFDPAERVTAADALKDPYFTNAQGQNLGEHDVQMDTS